MDILSIIVFLTACVAGIFVALCSFANACKKETKVLKLKSGCLNMKHAPKEMEHMANPETPIEEDVATDPVKSNNSKKRGFNIPVLVLNHSDINTQFVLALGKLLNKERIRMVLWDNNSYLDQCENLVLLICNNYSRLDSDVRSSLNGLPFSYRRVFLVVFHFKEEIDLPMIETEVMLNSDEALRNISKIVDMAFYGDGSEKRIYKCNMNDKALHEIVCYVKNGKFCKC